MAISFSYCASTVQILKIASVSINETIQMHSHAKDCYELHYIDNGKGTLFVGQHDFTLRSGSLFVTGPNVMHKQIPDETKPMHELCLYLVIKNSKTAQDVLKYFTSHTFWIGEGNKRIRKLFSEIIMEYENNLKWSNHLISAMVIELVVEMAMLYTPKSRDFHPNRKTDLNENREWILDELFYNLCADGTLSDFAESLGVCPRQAERIIVDSYGKTFKQQRQEARLAKAAAILEEGDVTVEQCASQCGYTSVTSFSKAFKKKYLVTPKVYRLQNNANQK